MKTSEEILAEIERATKDWEWFYGVADTDEATNIAATVVREMEKLKSFITSDEPDCKNTLSNDIPLTSDGGFDWSKRHAVGKIKDGMYECIKCGLKFDANAKDDTWADFL